MTSPDDGIATQIRNIESRYGRPMAEWFSLIAASGLVKHTEVVAMLKASHGMAHAAAHRVSLLSRQAVSAPAAVAAGAAAGSAGAAADEIYVGKKASLRPLHDQLMDVINGFGGDVVTAQKKGYLSIRRKKQFAMIQPSTVGRLDLGLILRGVPAAGRLEPAGSFNALFTHRVRLTSAADIDAELIDWLRNGYLEAG